MIQIQDNIQNVKCSSKAHLERLKIEENELQSDVETIKEKLDTQDRKINLTLNRKPIEKEFSSSMCPVSLFSNRFRFPIDCVFFY